MKYGREMYQSGNRPSANFVHEILNHTNSILQFIGHRGIYTDRNFAIFFHAVQVKPLTLLASKADLMSNTQFTTWLANA